MARIVMAAYRPKPRQGPALRALIATHVSRLREEGLVTDREPICMEAADGTIVEVFEWVSREAIDRAHHNPRVQQMWAELAEVCDYVPIGSLPETGELFSEFSALRPN